MNKQVLKELIELSKQGKNEEITDYLKRELEDELRQDENFYPRPTSDKHFRRLIIDHFLGEDWYVIDPLSSEQINTVALAEIMGKYKGYKNKKVKYMRF